MAVPLMGCAAPPVASSPPHTAATSSSPSLSRALRKRIAREWFVVGAHAIAEQRYAEGIHAWETAYGFLPHPNVAFNLGRANAEYGEYAASIRWLKVYLESAPSDRAEVEEVIESMRKRVERRLLRLADEAHPR